MQLVEPEPEDSLEIRLHEVLWETEHEMGEAVALEKDGVERDLQEALAALPEALEPGLRLDRREWPTAQSEPRCHCGIIVFDICSPIETGHGRALASAWLASQI